MVTQVDMILKGLLAIRFNGLSPYTAFHGTLYLLQFVSSWRFPVFK